VETFVVQVWVPGGTETGAPPGVLRGLVAHPRTGRSIRFADGNDLLVSIDSFLEPERRPDAQPPRAWPTAQT